MITFDHVTKKYMDKTALTEVSFTLPDTGLIIIKGKNGSGKTTLLNLLGALDEPTGGTIEVNGTKLNSLDRYTLSKFREEYIAYIFQNGNLFENMTVRDNIEIVNTNKNIENLTKVLKISDLLDEKAKNISGGEAQRVGIARALIKNAKIVLADEPTSALDPETKEDVFKILKHLSETRLVVMITHDVDLAENYADITLTLEDGHLLTLNKIRSNDKECTIPTSKNNFNPLSFTFKNLFSNSKKIKRSCLILMSTSLIILLSLTLGTLDFQQMHYDTAVDEQFELYEIASFTKDGEYSPYGGTLVEKDIDYIKNRLPEGVEMKIEWAYSYTDSFASFYFGKEEDEGETNYTPFVIAPSFKDIDELDPTSLKYGQMPTKENEVLISTYVADAIINRGVLDNRAGQFYKPKNREQLLTDRKEIYLGNLPIVVAGIYEHDLSVFKTYESDPLKWYMVTDYYATDIYAKNMEDYLPKVFSLDYSTKINGYDYSPAKIRINYDDIELSTEEKISIAEDEIVVSKDLLFTLGYDSFDYYDKELALTIYKNGTLCETKNYKIKGISKDDYTYTNEASLDPYLKKYEKKYMKVLISERDPKRLKKITDAFSIDKGFYRLKSAFSEDYLELKKTIKTVSIVFKALSIIFVFIGVAQLYNYIKNSVALHKKDIATLKCLGIKDGQILNSFAIESIFISLLSYLMTIASFIPLALLANSICSNVLNFKIKILPLNIKLNVALILSSVVLSYSIGILIFKKIKNTRPIEVFQNDSL